ncbi:MAG: valine--tRNA ligase [Clostridia bacterium]
MLDKSFNPASFERDIYKNWLDKGYFKAHVDKTKKPFCIIMPPPNITAKLHVGHAFNCSLQDTLIRYKKMCGYETLLQPGTDHAAIATESKIVSELASQGIKKEDIGRAEFLHHAQNWYDKYNEIILNQFKSLGLACDWDRLAFTMDDHCSLAVRTVFVKMYNDGLIYKGDRMTNWCPHCMTALSDIEVEHEDSDSKLWYIKYPITGTNDYLQVATTRPETLIGDTAVAVNPKDSRYSKLVGKTVDLPLCDRSIPVVADMMVETEFGTGVVKITPAHDPNDYECSIRHNLPIIQVIERNGKMSESAGKYAGMDRFEARKAIVQDLKEQGYLIKEEKYHNSVGHCSRCDTIVEPAFTKQWFVKMKGIAQPAIDCVKSGELQIYPARMKKVYLNWLENVHDWCISRQLWSGHQIPVFTCADCGHEWASVDKPVECPHCHSKTFTQDLDVLDTWFSSALWPMSTLGFPDNEEYLNYFYPTDVMITGYDIIFLWVARMVFSGLYNVNKIPFRKVFLNGIVRDELGRKMSKNLGNGIDPVDVINKYGTDALRLSLVYNVTLGADSRYSMKNAENASIFLNKVYNAGKYVLANVEGAKDIKDIKLNVFDKWIMSELNSTITQIHKCLDKLDIGKYTTLIYDFVWFKFCDKYIELNKVSPNPSVLLHVYQSILQLLHPVAPFVTEKIYQELPNHKYSILDTAFPTASKLSYSKEEKDLCEDIFEIIGLIRAIRGENKIGENIKVDTYFDLKNAEAIKDYLPHIKKMCLINEVEFGAPTSTKEYLSKTNILGTLYIRNPNYAGVEALRTQYLEKIAFYQAEIDRSERMLNNAGFMAKAPEALKASEREKLAKNTELKAQMQELLEKLDNE